MKITKIGDMGITVSFTLDDIAADQWVEAFQRAISQFSFNTVELDTVVKTISNAIVDKEGQYRTIGEALERLENEWKFLDKGIPESAPAAHAQRNRKPKLKKRFRFSRANC